MGSPMSWATALNTQDDDFAHMLAARDMQNQRLLQIAGAFEQQHQNRENDALRREQMQAVADQRAAALEERKSARESLDEQRRGKAAKENAEAAAKAEATKKVAEHAAKLQAIIDDPNADPAMKRAAQWEQADLKYKPSDLQAGDAKVPVIRINPRTGKVEQVGEAPKGAHFVNEPAPPVAPNLHFQIGMGSDGQLVTQGIDPKTGKVVNPNVTAAPPTMDQRNRKTALDVVTPVFDQMDELVNRINTHKGLYAKASGEAAKLAAKANLDNDVAEYQAILRIYAPVILRAHGLLRPQSEQIEHFITQGAPQPGDDQDLAQRKMRDLRNIGANMSEAYGAGKTPPVPPAKTKKRIKFNAQGNEVP